MAEKHEPDAFREDAPTLWPHLSAEKVLPSNFGGRLTEVIDAVPNDRERAVQAVALMRLPLGHCHAGDGRAGLTRGEHTRAFHALPDLQAVDVSCSTPTGASSPDTIASAALRKLAAWVPRWKSLLEGGLAWMRLVGLLEAAGDPKGAYEAFSGVTRSESQQQQREAIAMRAELLALDLEAESELCKTGQTLAHGQRLSNVGHLVAGVNHELNQPMASIRMLAETAIELVHQGDHAAAQDNIHAMLKLSGRLMDMASKLAAFPAQSESAVCSVCLADAVDEALATLRSRLVQTPCEILRDLPALAVRAQEAQLVRVIANLVNNALDAVVHCEPRRIAFACSTADEVVTLSVSDSGPGLSEAVRERLFQPFFSTKPVGQGLGLGLALSRDVMREMGGDLTARNGSEGGAVFEIRLPLAIGVAPHASLT